MNDTDKKDSVDQLYELARQKIVELQAQQKEETKRAETMSRQNADQQKIAALRQDILDSF